MNGGTRCNAPSTVDPTGSRKAQVNLTNDGSEFVDAERAPSLSPIPQASEQNNTERWKLLGLTVLLLL
jgi:hypothetical protein